MSYGRTGLLLVILRALNSGLGFLFGILLASVFGANRQTDALMIAMAVPVMLFRDIGGGGVVGALTPLLVEEQERQNTTGFIPTYRWVMTITAVALTLLGLVGGRAVIRLMAPGFDAETTELAVRMFRWLTPSIGLFLIFGSLQGFHYARGSFLASEWGRFAWRVTAIVGCLFFGRRYGVSALAISLSAAVVLQWALAHRLGPKGVREWAWTPPRPVQWRALRPFGKALAVIGASIALNEAEKIVDRVTMSYFPEGSVSQYLYAWRLALQLPLLLSFSLLTPLIPDVTRMKMRASRGRERMIQLFAFHMGALGFVLGLLFYRAAPDLVRLLLLRGQFDAASAEVVTAATRIMAIAIPAYMISRPFKGHYYVERHMRMTVQVGVLAFLVHTAGNILLRRHGVPGIALSLAISTWSTAGYLWIATPSREPRRLPFLSAVMAAAAAAAWLFGPNWNAWMPATLPRLMALAGGTALLYLLCMMRSIRRAERQLRDTLNDGTGRSE